MIVLLLNSAEDIDAPPLFKYSVHQTRSKGDKRWRNTIQLRHMEQIVD
jgi:hypothetical protein